MGKKKLQPVHPGEVLLEEFLKPMGLSQNRVAINIGVPPRRINEIILQKRRITADTALRFARFFGTSPEFWLGLQAQYDLDVTSDELGERTVMPFRLDRKKHTDFSKN
ncbi:MAG: addiction module antidote protein, HigA family [Acinetobacter sp. RIFCSPHIGHO2_12_41_5]|nr:MAG: addiction module antidote protein, HigA family [Acinetobacter sp. RIFCSPHIGHO2_12_41_5]